MANDYQAADRPTRASSRMAMVRARLNLPTIRRASGLFEGNHSSIFVGHGHDFEDLIEYNYGDDVSDIDWKSSARGGKPIIRRFERESDVFTQLVVDTGMEMRGSTPSGESKADVAVLVADVLGYLAAHRGDRLGLVFGDSTKITRHAARHGNEHLEFILNTMDAQMAASKGTSTVSKLLEHLLRTYLPRALLIVITDEYWPGAGDEQTLRRLRTRHELLVVQVADMPITQPGIDRMVDVDGTALPRYIREDKRLAQEIANERETSREAAKNWLRSNGVMHARVTSSDDVVPVLFDLLRRQHRARR